MPPYQLADRSGGNRRPSGHAQPGGRDVDVEDSNGLALEIIRRRDRQAAVDAREQQQRADAQQPAGSGPGDLQETGRIGVTVHRLVPPLADRLPSFNQARPISFCAMASATAAGSCPVAALSAQICSSRPGIASIRERTSSGPPSPRYSVETLMIPPAL